MKEKRFYLISLIATYVYLKEKYKSVESGVTKSLQEDKDSIVALIQPLEKFIVIPDKSDFVNKAFIEISDLCNQKERGQESLFIQRVKSYSEDLSKEEKDEIINILIYVTDEDRKISDNEKEVILQVADCFGIEDNYATLLVKYKKSSIKKPFSSLMMTMIASVLIFITITSMYYLIEIRKDNKQFEVFKEKIVMFNKITFNRFLIYKNKYEIESSHFAKQAVFNVSGTAEVGFEPRNIEYDIVNKVITYHLPKDTPFNIGMTSKTILVDQANPVALTADEATKISVGLSIAGGIIGSGVGKSLGSLYPHPMGKMIGAGAGAVLGASATGVIAFTELNGLKIVKDISKKEKKIVIEKSVDIIRAMLSYNSELTQTYQDGFEKYVKASYARYGFEVKQVIFDDNNLNKQRGE